MVLYRIKLFFILILFLALLSCQSGSLREENSEDADLFFLTGKCKYIKFPGTALILSFDIQNETDVKIVFNFNPEVPEQKEQYRFPHFPDDDRTKIIKVNKNDPESWIREIGMEYDNKIDCIRCEIISGTCSPVIYLFPSANTI